MHHRLLAVAVTLTLVPATRAAAPTPTLPAEDELPGATRAQAIEAYVKDCHATLKAPQWIEGEEETVDECKALDINQNCNPDTFGCQGGLDSCQVACKPVCGKCQDNCATTCDDCKSQCAPGDKACIRACATTRADCRGRCVKGLRACQQEDCTKAEDQCMVSAVKQLKTCDSEKCDAYWACVDQDEEHWEKADALCGPKNASESEFCRRVCNMERGIPTWYDEVVASPDGPTDPNDGPSLARACTAEAQCPADYAVVAPYLASFCSGATTDASFKALEGDLARGRVSKRSVGLVFNAYGAFHGYQFKKETWMNGFFYGAGGAWLPPACRGKMKTVASAKVMPFRLTKARDRFKQIYDAAR